MHTIKKHLFLPICMCAVPSIAQAIPVAETLPLRSFGLGLSSHYVQQADLNRSQRFRLDFLSLETLNENLRWENQIAWAPDRQNYPSALKIRQDLYEWSSAIRYNFPNLFRYGLSLGPMLRLEHTEIEVKTEQKTQQTHNRWTLGWRAAATLDYAIHRDWELSFFLAYLARPIGDKADFAFGAILLRNSSESR